MGQKEQLAISILTESLVHLQKVMSEELEERHNLQEKLDYYDNHRDLMKIKERDLTEMIRELNNKE